MPLLLEGKTIGTRRAVSGVKPVITAAQRALAPRDVALERASVEAYDELKGQFRDALFRALGRYRQEELTARELEQSWRASIREHWLQAYALGNRSEGYTAGLEDADRTWLKGAWGEEYRYLGKFVQALDNDALNMPADDRLDMYVETLDGMFHAGRVDALPENVRIHWRLGPVRTEHCAGCRQLAAESPYDKPGAGGPNPLWTTPRAGDTPCITGCKCSLVVEEIPVEEVPPRERTVPVGRPEVDERIPEGFRAPGPSERAYVENLMSRIAFSRLALQDLQGDAKRQEILVRHRLADELTKFLTAKKLWVRPTWATGQAEVGDAVSADALEEVFAGRELTPAGLGVLQALDADRYEQLMEQFDARVLSKLALQKMSPELAKRAEKIADLTALGLAGGAAAVLARRGREESPALAADRRGEEEVEEAIHLGVPLREDVTTSLNVAGAPGIGPGADFKRARFLKGQRLKWQGLGWKVASVSFAPAPRRYVYVLVSETGQARIVTESELDGVEVTGQLGREAQMVMDGALPLGVFIERALQEGGAGSGHFGHKGRKKLRGGSLPGVAFARSRRTAGVAEENGASMKGRLEEAEVNVVRIASQQTVVCGDRRLTVVERCLDGAGRVVVVLTDELQALEIMAEEDLLRAIGPPSLGRRTLEVMRGGSMRELVEAALSGQPVLDARPGPSHGLRQLSAVLAEYRPPVEERLIAVADHPVQVHVPKQDLPPVLVHVHPSTPTPIEVNVPERQAPNIDVHVPASNVEVHVEPATVHLPAPRVEVMTPEPRVEIRVDLREALEEVLGTLKDSVQKMRETIVVQVAAPIVNVEMPAIHVAAPQVLVQVPEQPAPQVTVHVAAADAPKITVEPQITVVMPDPKDVEKTIERDQLTGLVTKVIEKHVE